MRTELPNLAETVVATARYLDAVTKLDDADVREPCLLPGWTRAHLITHVARNADALAGVLRGAEAGELRSMYPSLEQREADIESGAERSAADLREDAIASAGRWHQAANEVHASNLDAPGCSRPGTEPWPVRRVGVLRRTEVEVHHADLGTGYTAADWPEDFVAALMKRRERELSVDGPAFTWRSTDTGHSWSSGEGPTVQGTVADLLWWLLGRGSGDRLSCSAGSLPELGAWS